MQSEGVFELDIDGVVELRLFHSRETNRSSDDKPMQLGSRT